MTAAIAVVVAMIALAWLFWPREYSTYRKERNPYRRWCKRCGQCQLFYTSHPENHYGWWGDVLPVPDESCACHKDVGE